MSKLAGRKVLCFIALPHHNRFLVPIMDLLRTHGMEVVYFTAAAEGAFEITLNQAKLPYRHLLDYSDSETAAKVENAYRRLRPIYQEKILRSRTFQAVPVVIQDKTIRPAVENFYCLTRMLEIEKPDCLFALHELNPWGKMLGYLSHVYRIPYFTLQEGLYYADVHYYRFHTDFSTACLVWGEDCRQLLCRAGCGDDKIYPVGNTHIWGAKAEAASSIAIQQTRDELKIGVGIKIVLFLMSHSHYQPFDMRPFLSWLESRGDVVAVFKWHPVTGKDIINRALEHTSASAPVIKASELDTYRLIGASEICVTVGNTTTGLEAIAFEKPVIECRLPDQTYSFADRGVAEVATGFEDLGSKCDAILEHGLPGRRQQQIEKYLDHNFAYRDQQTLRRIVDLVDESLQARSRTMTPVEPVPIKSGVIFRCSIILPVDNVPPAMLMATLASIVENTPESLYEVIVIDCSTSAETKHLLAGLGGDVKCVPGEETWSYSSACNRGVEEAQGEYVVLLKPGLTVSPQWLESLLLIAEKESNVGVVGGLTVNENGLVWHMGIAFDVNQSPFCLYRLMPTQLPPIQKARPFKALKTPFVTSRNLYSRLGGLSTEFVNRFEDIDFSLSASVNAGLKVIYTPRAIFNLRYESWSACKKPDYLNRIRFYSKWAGHVWQDDESYLDEDGLTHDDLTRMYQELAHRIAQGALHLSSTLSTKSL
jgi:GT2 family glycosyltransferase